MTMNEKREIVRNLMAAGETTISAMEAAPLLSINKNTMLESARRGMYDPMRQAFFAGRNLRVCTNWIAEVLGVRE